MNPILLDTHVALWGSAGELATTTQQTIDDAARRRELLLSPITAWEIGMLVDKGRLSLRTPAADYVRALFAQPGAVTAQITPEIALAAAEISNEPPLDPADRILIATASAYGAQLVTRGRTILDYAKRTKALHCVAC